MARRIAFVVIALVTLLLGAVAVPLGLVTASQDRRDFATETVAASATVAGVAEEQLGDHATGPAFAKALAAVLRQGDQVAVYDRSGAVLAGTVLAGTGAISGVSPRLLRRAASSRVDLAGYPTPDRLLVVTPIGHGAARGQMGTVALSRSTEPLDHRIAVLWTWLAAVAAAGLAVAAAMAAALARWVSRPLGGLDDAARRLGDGTLGTRALVSSGPPEVRRLGGNFNHMAGRLEALVDGHRAMMADVSHQLRTPLTALRLRLDLLAEESPQHVATELGGAQDEVARLSRLVDGLLAVARAEHQTVAPVPVRVDQVAADRMQAWRPAVEEKAIGLRAAGLAPLTARLGDGHLEQVLDNVLANALDAVSPGGQIVLSVASAGSCARITVADNGPGMSGPQRRAAFRRYLSSTPGGTGLGLAIVHRLITSAGGTVELSDTAGGGLTVTIDLPGYTDQPRRW